MESRIRDVIGRSSVDMIVVEVKDNAIMSLELVAVNMLELCSPTTLTNPALCNTLGLRPGFAVGLCERKPYGSNEGDLWDLN